VAALKRKNEFVRISAGFTIERGKTAFGAIITSAHWLYTWPSWKAFPA